MLRSQYYSQSSMQVQSSLRSKSCLPWWDQNLHKTCSLQSGRGPMGWKIPVCSQLWLTEISIQCFSQAISMAKEKSKPNKLFSDFLNKSGMFSVNIWWDLNWIATKLMTTILISTLTMAVPSTSPNVHVLTKLNDGHHLHCYSFFLHNRKIYKLQKTVAYLRKPASILTTLLSVAIRLNWTVMLESK